LKKQIKIVILLLVSIFFSCLKDESIKLQFEAYTPEQLNDGWEVSTPEEEGLIKGEIDRVYRKIYSEELYPTIHSLLIVKNGKLISEAYCRDKSERDRFHHLQSATKSITSILFGIAVDRELIESVNETVYYYIPQFFDANPVKREITLHHVLTMQTGLDFDNDINTQELFNGDGSSIAYVLGNNLQFSPGTAYNYNDGDPQLISAVIQQVTGMTEEEFAVENLFQPLDITLYQWESHGDDKTFGAFGLWLKPRDMAKIGQLLVQKGIWNGRQIISQEWIALSTRKQALYEDYGYYWNIKAETGAFYAAGHGGQYIHIVPDKNLVIITTAAPYSDMNALSDSFYGLINDIENAVRE